ncbi:hypothetical protein GCM10025859_14250 [Alicyclobacillus fastidiosus]|nr:hypothetical protein GCM10025859_14250 [Alicyclobacillus fastidiosus]
MFPFRIALNSSTLRPFNLNVVEQLKITSEAGYEGIELWMADIMSYIENGGSTRALTEYMNDVGISFVNAIAFFDGLTETVFSERLLFIRPEKRWKYSLIWGVRL